MSSQPHLPRIPPASDSDAKDERAAAAVRVEDEGLIELLRATQFPSASKAGAALIQAATDASAVEIFPTPLAQTIPDRVDAALWRLAVQAASEGQQVVEFSSQPRHDTAAMAIASVLRTEAGEVFAVLACRIPPDTWKREGCRARFERAVRLTEERLRGIRAFEDLHRSVARLEKAERLQRALFAIADQASADREMPDVFRALHSIVGSLMYAENFYIVLYDAARGTLRFPYFVDTVDQEPPGEGDIPMHQMQHSMTWHLMQHGRALMGGPQELERQIESKGPLAQFGPDCVDWLGVPLLRGGQVVGGIVVQSYTEAAHFTPEDRALLTYVAQHILTALERRMAHEELERRVLERTDALRDANRVLQQQVLERQRGERLQAALFRIAELGHTTESLEDFYAAVHRVVGGLLYARNFYIALLSDDHGYLTFPYSVDEYDRNRKPRRLGMGLTEYVLRTGTALLADRAGLERLNSAGAVHSIGTRSRSWLGVPLICADRTVGVIAVQSYSDEHRYTPRDQELLTFVSYHIANALERKRNGESLRQAYAKLEQRVVERTGELAALNRDLREQIMVRERVERQLKHETLHDALTGLPNRNFLLDRLSQALASFARDPRRRFAVLFLDLDRFKVINDSVGHLVGDELLNEVGGRIAGCLEPRDLVARLGGDEFAVVLNDIEDGEDACLFAQRIIDVLNAPIRLSGKEVFTSASVGIAIAAERYRKAEELLRDADVAMYRAKSEGRHRYALFDEGLHQEAMRLLELESDLRRAIARSEFVPFFQPIMRLSDRKLVGYEALLRWQHPERGLLLPVDFLGVAEDNGAAEEIDWQIYERVFELAPSLLADGGFISVNLSGRHFRSESLGSDFLSLLRRHNVAPSSVRIEVTERMLIDNPPAAKRLLENLRRDGLGVALDDFGTGYSSLSYLHQYPLQSLKIDRSFVANLAGEETAGAVAVVRAIQALADTLGLQVIAEGIETEGQRRILMELGCQFGQGFLLGRPQPAAVWLERTAVV
ncbi:MAG TPA: EAL domain-containing protein [Rudaea sp.]